MFKKKDITTKLYEDKIRKLEKENNYLKNQVEIYRTQRQDVENLHEEYQQLIADVKALRDKVNKQFTESQKVVESYKKEVDKFVNK